jgi:tetratricopeptide (TPR) repeat protein
VARFRVGEAEVLAGRYDEAKANFQASLALGQEIGDRDRVAWSLFGLGLAYLGEQRVAEAHEHLCEAVSIHLALDHPWHAKQCTAYRADAALGLGQAAEAEGYLRVALRLATEEMRFGPIAFALPAVALLLLARGEVAGAVELQALGSRYPLLSKARFYKDIAWRHITAAAAELPPEVVTAAWERGRARDLYETAAEFLAEL